MTIQVEDGLTHKGVPKLFSNISIKIRIGDMAILIHYPSLYKMKIQKLRTLIYNRF